MSTYAWIVTALAAFDLFMLGSAWILFRLDAPHDRRVLLPVACGLLGFVFHAVLFFDGAILALQLLTIAGLFGMAVFWSSARAPDGHNG
jgi:hypothetical protein